MYIWDVVINVSAKYPCVAYEIEMETTIQTN